MRPVVASLASLLFVACTTAASAEDKHDHTERTHHVVIINELSVHPEVLNPGPEDVVVFVNYTGQPVQVRFDASAKDSFTCPARPTFYLTGGGGLVSKPFGPLEFAMPCRLKPGSYDYSILSTGKQQNIELDRVEPSDPKGKIVVPAP